MSKFMDYVEATIGAEELDDMMYSDEYAEFIMKNGDRPCYDGDMLTILMEEGYLFEQYLLNL